MKSLMPWFCLAAATSMQVAFAGESLDAYRLGNYDKAANQLTQNNKKDPVIDYYLGRMRLYGYGELKNDILALRHFKEAAERGFLPAQNIMARYALLKENNPEKALYWFQKAADSDDTAAQLYCAAAYIFGFGTKKNPGFARRYYIAAAKSGDPIAQYTLAEHFLESRHRSNHKLGLIWLEKSVEQGNPLAELKLGELYARGIHVKKDLDKAISLMKLAANQNYWPAAFALGDLAKEQKAYPEAKEWYLKAATHGFLPAQFALAELYLNSETPFHDTHEGYLWMLKAAQNNYEKAQLALSKFYSEGKVVPQDEHLAKEWQKMALQTAQGETSNAKIQAINWLTNGKKNSFADSDYQLKGIFSAWKNPNALKENNYNPAPEMDVITRESLYKPDFVMTDPKQIDISEYYDALAASLGKTKGSEAGFPRYAFDSSRLILPIKPLLPESYSITYRQDEPLYPAINEEQEFDVLYYFSEQEVKPERRALFDEVFEKAILGNAEAQFRLGQMYEQGIEVEKNIDKAMKYYFLAAEQEDTRAEYNLGLLFLEGKEMKPDHKVALGFLMEAAFKGNDHAEYALAKIYEQGYRNADGEEVIAPDKEQALDMYYLAAANQYGPAQYRLAEILVREKPQDISVAAKKERKQLIKKLYQGAVHGGVQEAALPLAFFNAMEKDKHKQVQALQAAKLEAGKGNGHAALLLGLLYDRGIAVERNPSEALYWYQQGELNPVSAFILGTYYSKGDGINKDLAKGKMLLQQAADQGFAYANMNLAILKKQQNEDFVDELDKARSLGNSKAGLLMADYYLSLAGDDEQMKAARHIYQYFAEKGDKEAQLKLAYMYEQGLGGAADMNEAEKWYLSAALQNQPIAQYLLARFYQLGKQGSYPDYAKAREWYEKAQNQYSPASVALGFIADTVEDNYQEAKVAYQKAVKQENPIGAYNLALIYELGKGNAVDYERAKQLYYQAARLNHSQAMVQLAGIYFNGLAGPRDEQKALHWYKKAAKQGNRDALYQLGLLSETGVATKLDFKEAVNYYQGAAKLGNAKAILALARMYQYGLGVKKDSELAKKMYEELASHNNPYAQYQLALFYYDAGADERQLEKTRELLLLAQKNGSQQAQRALQWLEAQSKERLSYIEPVILNQTLVMADRPADLMYLDALNEWNRGDEALSRRILNRIMREFPHYIPAKRAYEQLHQKTSSGIFS